MTHHWMVSSLPCVGQTAIFFSEDERLIKLAKEMCKTCPCQLPCLDASLGEEFGVWGSLTPAQRRSYATKLTRRFRKLMPALQPSIDVIAAQLYESMACLL